MAARNPSREKSRLCSGSSQQSRKAMEGTEEKTGVILETESGCESWEHRGVGGGGFEHQRLGGISKPESELEQFVMWLFWESHSSHFSAAQQTPCAQTFICKTGG